MSSIHIRTEDSQDAAEVRSLLVQAFGNQEEEAALVERIRQSEGCIPTLSIVAERDNEIIGHILISKAKVVYDAGEHEVLALAPVAVRPDLQKQGIGEALIKEGLKRSQELGYDLVLLIGHPSYYPRLGFKTARSYGLELTQYPVPDEVFMVYELKRGALGTITGELMYPAPFFG